MLLKFIFTFYNSLYYFYCIVFVEKGSIKCC